MIDDESLSRSALNRWHCEMSKLKCWGVTAKRARLYTFESYVNPVVFPNLPFQFWPFPDKAGSLTNRMDQMKRVRCGECAIYPKIAYALARG